MHRQDMYLCTCVVQLGEKNKRRVIDYGLSHNRLCLHIIDYVSPFLANLLRCLLDPDSSVRTACAHTVAALSASHPFSSFFKPLAQTLFTEQNPPSQAGAVEALKRLALAERHLLSQFKDGCFKVFEDRRFDKVKLVREVGLWVFGGLLNIDVVSRCNSGISVLLVTGVVTWKECLVKELPGILSHVKFVGGLGLSWQLSFGILVLLYFYSHYFFTSGAAHIGAMFAAFLSIATALGTPPYFGAIMLSFLSNLMGGLTHYGVSWSFTQN
ncbi:hypothetical protein Fmac_029132 [Flemingia macrophylla]|uniref:Uncharacterized protein n=1 Tax=Flemingia macrophylla TaxID=520843 RepID=A0ABD1LA04_9FABA